MADCSKVLKKYDEQSTLDNDKRDRLRSKRDELKNIIKDWFSEKDKYAPDFKGQGSFTMKTIINPKDEGDLYDIDLGVYIDKRDLEKEGEDFINANTAQGWVKCAVEKYIEDKKDKSLVEKVEHKNKCIRVYYKEKKGEEKFHVDLPVYYKDEDGTCNLAVKNNSTNSDNGWEKSDPRAIVEWFWGEIDKKGERLRRVVRYLKNWSALQSWNNSKPSGLLLTVLASENFDNCSEVDDLSLLETTKKIKTSINTLIFKPSLSNPVDNNEDLLKPYSKEAINAWVEKLTNFIDKMTLAYQLDEQKEAEEIWQKIYTDIILDSQGDDANNLQTKSPAIIGNSNRSA